MRIELFDQMFNEKERPLCQFDAFPLQHSDTKRGGRPAHNKRQRRDYCLAVPGSAGMAREFPMDATNNAIQCLMNLFLPVNICKNYGAFMIHCGINWTWSAWH